MSAYVSAVEVSHRNKQILKRLRVHLSLKLFRITEVKWVFIFLIN